MKTTDTVYAIHVVDRNGERVFTSIALLREEVKPVLKSIKVGKALSKKIYDICSNKYVTKIK